MKKKQKIPTPSYLENAALYYLSRYAASESSLRRVLSNKINRAKMQHEDFAADHALHKNLQQKIEDIIAAHKKSGAINDATFAAMKINSLRRQGRSRRAIQQKLAIKGIAGSTVSAALSSYDEDGEMTAAETEMKAALTLAKRRKFGPFGKNSADPDIKRKQIAAMARGGFGMDVIRKILDADIDEWPE